MKQQKNGSAVLVMLGVISIVMIVCGMLGFSATQQMRATQITREMLKARLIAESGLNKAYNAVKENFDAVAGYQESNVAFGGGTYTVKTADFFTADGTQRARLVSEGVCGIGRSVVSADLENRPKVLTNEDGTGNYFDLVHDLLVGGILELKGKFHASVATIHANGDIVLTGSSKTDAVTISSTGTITWKKSDGTETKLEGQKAVEIYSAALQAAINRFIAHAIKHGAVYARGADIPESPPGGVAVCTGSSKGWSKTGTGTFIFLGDVSLQGSGLAITSLNGYPALIVLSASDVHINAGTVIHGAVIMPLASIKINGHAEIYGPLLIGQGMTGNGTADLYAEGGQGFALPPDETVTDNVVITAWH